MLIGLQKQWNILKAAAEKNKLPHAFLFCGPDMLGKKTMALELAKFIFCQEKKEESVFSCGKCRSCLDTAKKIHPDISLAEPEEGSIKISQIRELERKLSLRPYSAKVKIGIINDAHLMLADAQNSLLKTLEEPKGETILILISSNPQMLLKTIFSRVRMLKFFPVSEAEIEKELVFLGAEKTKAKKLAKLAMGKPGQAIEFLKDFEKYSSQEKFLEETEKIIKAGLPEKFNYVKRITDNPEDTDKAIIFLQKSFRDKLASSHGATQKSLVQPIKDLEEAAYLIKTTNASPRLILENLMLNLKS